jgi:hypothetical protein
MSFEDYQQFVYGLTQECFVRTDLNLNPEKDAFIATLEFMGAQCISEIEDKLTEKGFNRLRQDKLIYQVQLSL